MSRKESKKTDTTVMVAVLGLAGTIIAALLSSPVLVKVLDQVRGTPTLAAGTVAASSPTIPAEAVQVFAGDFEDGTADGFGFSSVQWSVTKEKSNQVLDLEALSPATDAQPIASFGPADLTDGIIELRVKFVQTGTLDLNFRDDGSSGYALSLSADQILLGYEGEDTGGSLVPLAANTKLPFAFQTDRWYTLHIEARRDKLSISIDGNRLLTATDARLSHGGLNLQMDQGTHVLLDDVKVWSLE
jgi:hypothetical protein